LWSGYNKVIIHYMTNVTLFLAIVHPRSANPNVNTPRRVLSMFRCPVTAQRTVDAFIDANPGFDGFTADIVRPLDS